jgi:hypothetical protein
MVSGVKRNSETVLLGNNLFVLGSQEKIPLPDLIPILTNWIRKFGFEMLHSDGRSQRQYYSKEHTMGTAQNLPNKEVLGSRFS